MGVMAIIERPSDITGSGGDFYGKKDLAKPISESVGEKISGALRLVHPRHELSAHLGKGKDALVIPVGDLEDVEATDEPGEFFIKIRDQITGRNIAIAASGTAILGLSIHILRSRAKNKTKS